VLLRGKFIAFIDTLYFGPTARFHAMDDEANQAEAYQTSGKINPDIDDIAVSARIKKLNGFVDKRHGQKPKQWRRKNPFALFPKRKAQRETKKEILRKMRQLAHRKGRKCNGNSDTRKKILEKHQNKLALLVGLFAGKHGIMKNPQRNEDGQSLKKQLLPFMLFHKVIPLLTL
jgi:hypothetical protein